MLRSWFIVAYASATLAQSMSTTPSMKEAQLCTLHLARSELEAGMQPGRRLARFLPH